MIFIEKKVQKLKESFQQLWNEGRHGKHHEKMEYFKSEERNP